MGLQVRVGLLGLRNGLGRVAGLFYVPRDHPCHDGVFFMCFFERSVELATQVDEVDHVQGQRLALRYRNQLSDRGLRLHTRGNCELCGRESLHGIPLA